MKWDPVPAEDLAAKDCAYDPGVSAELLFVRQVLDASASTEWVDNYRRIKIYNLKGAEDVGVMSIDYPGNQKVWNLSARVVKAGGETVEYGQKNFTETVAARYKGTNWKRWTLAVPSLEAGDILEFQWSSSIESETYLYSWWYSQLDLPVRKFNFRVKDSAHDCRLLWFNSSNDIDRSAKSPQIQLNLQYLPGFTAEPHMAPERDVRAWYLLLYTDMWQRWYGAEEMWKSVSAFYDEGFRARTRPDGTIKAKAAELVKGATGPEEQLRRLYEFCQREISNLDYFDSAELQKLKKRVDDKDPGAKATLATGAGYSRHLNELFASLARAAGFEVALARSATRHITLNVKNENGWIFLRDDLICVKVGGAWKQYAPGDYHVPAGLLDSSNELAPSLICSPDEVVLRNNGMAAAADSRESRHARLTLDAEGNLEGEVQLTLTGHRAVKRRRDAHGLQREEIDRAFIEDLTRRLPTAEISDLAWENLGDNRRPLVIRYKLRVPGYADAIGSKLIVPVNVFQRGVPAVFAAETRRYPIYFDHAWSEVDEVELVLPEGGGVADLSEPAKVGALNEAIGADYQATYDADTRTLSYRRDFVVGGNRAIAFQPASYRVLKRMFDGIKRSDEHAVVVEIAETAAAADGAATH